jgi:hypothetical protein
MLFRETIALYCENNMKRKNPLCEQSFSTYILKGYLYRGGFRYEQLKITTTE